MIKFPLVIKEDWAMRWVEDATGAPVPLSEIVEAANGTRQEASFVRCDLSLDDFSKLEIKPGPIEFVPTPQYVEIGYLLKNEYGFVSASVQDLKALPVGQTPVYSRVPQTQNGKT